MKRIQQLDSDFLIALVNAEPVFQDMLNTVEDSPYHREANVYEHTMMVCKWYSDYTSMYFIPATDPHAIHLGLFACLLHDIAKPCCRVRKESKKRGVYYSYDMHDVVGGHMSEEMLVRHDVSEFDIYRISWMVEHHQIFWSTKRRDIREKMALTLIKRDFYLPFKYFMFADNYGRITDGPKEDAFAIFKQFEEEFDILKRLPTGR